MNDAHRYIYMKYIYIYKMNDAHHYIYIKKCVYIAYNRY